MFTATVHGTRFRHKLVPVVYVQTFYIEINEP